MDVVSHFAAAGVSILLMCFLIIALRTYPFVQYALTTAFTLIYAYLTGASIDAIYAYVVLVVLVILANGFSKRHGVFKFLALLYGLAIVLKLTPGFNTIGPVSSHLLSSTSGVWTIYGGINKALVGLILLPLVRYPAMKLHALGRHYPMLLSAPFLLAGIAWMAGLEPDFKISHFTFIFLFANLCFVVIAEEVFFRGMLQQMLVDYLNGRFAVPAGIVIASTLFGLAHIGGGLLLMLFASLAGLFYGIAYWRLQSIWASVFVHLGVNVLHIIVFKYPF